MRIANLSCRDGYTIKNQSDSFSGAPIVPSHPMSAVALGPRPVSMLCPHCKSQITTRIDSYPNAMAWVSGCVLCCVG